MKYFFNYYTLGFIFVMWLLSYLNLAAQTRKATAVPKRKNKPNPNSNCYVKAHKDMLKTIKNHKRDLAEAEDESEREDLMDNEPLITRNLVAYYKWSGLIN